MIICSEKKKNMNSFEVDWYNIVRNQNPVAQYSKVLENKEYIIYQNRPEINKLRQFYTPLINSNWEEISDILRF